VRRSIMIALIALLALAMAAPTVLAQGNGGAPSDLTRMSSYLPRILMPLIPTWPPSAVILTCESSLAEKQKR
jgi:hypothetical protein